MKFLSVVLLWTIFCIQNGFSYNILVVFSHPGKSHVNVYIPLVHELGERGHNVTVLTHVPVKNNSTRNVKEKVMLMCIYIPLVHELGERGHNVTVLTHVPVKNNSTRNVKEILIGKPMVEVIPLTEISPSRILSAFEAPYLIGSFAHKSCVSGLSHPSFQAFLKEDHSFDVILYEFFNSNCYFGLANKYKVPFIGLSSCSIMPWHANWFGSPQNPSVHQVIFTGFTQPMSFLNRLENTIEQLASNFWYQYDMERPGRKYSKKYVGEEPANPHQASLFLINSHHTIHGARPFTPSIVEVGGIHVENRKLKQIPKHLDDWINNSDEGVIYFSLGSMIKGDTFPEEKRMAFLRAFSRLPQRVLWKWENNSMPNKPDNVMIEKWMPQFDILCNPNVKLFISHAGLLGLTETVHCGVPTLMMPQFGDQMHNARYLENNGGGLVLPLSEVTEEKLFVALQKLLSPESQRKAKELSARFNDRPLSPMNTAVYWIEHVARHKGATHMRSPTIDQPFYQHFLIDVIAFLVVLLAISSYIIFKIIQITLRLIRQTNKTKEKSS